MKDRLKTLNFRTLDLNLLRVFDEVMAERSLTRAARNLSLTQPAVSNALRRLRETLGDELVKRSGQGMEPTPRALALWPTVRDALQQLQASLSPGEFVPAQATSTFVLARADATAAELMPGLIDILEHEAPGVSMRVVPLTTRDPRRLLDEEAADLAVGHFPPVLADLTARAQSGESVAFAHERLYNGEYVCVMRKGHPLASGPLTLNRFCIAKSDLGQRHLIADKNPRRRHAVINGCKSVILASQIGISKLLARNEFVRDLAVRGHRYTLPSLLHHQRCRVWDLGNRLPEL